MSFICGKCFSKMDIDKVSNIRLKIFCPICGSKWFIDDNEQELKIEETIEIEDAALLWSVHGKNNKYLFGYTEEELEKILN